MLKLALMMEVIALPAYAGRADSLAPASFFFTLDELLV